MPMSFNQIVYAVYVGLLLGVCFAASGLLGKLLSLEPKRRTAIVLVGNWIVNTIYCLATGVTDPWWWFLITDAVAARIVLYQPAGKAQALIGWAYMAQILMHIVYAVSARDSFAADPYWQVLIALAFVQVIILGGWHIGRWGLLSRDRRGRDSSVAVAPRDKGVAE